MYKLLLLSILIVVSFSCEKAENRIEVKAYISDALTYEKIKHAKIQLLEWRYSWFTESHYSIIKDSVFSNDDGHFILHYSPVKDYEYSLSVTKDSYFQDNGSLPLPYQDVNLVLFPHGYIKTHIINKIDSAKWLEINFTPIFNDQVIFRSGFINNQIFCKAFKDTSFITKTIGGVSNNLKILINYTDYIPNEQIIVDSSILTTVFDTVDFEVILSK
ncbi:hypothetical protein ACE1ET_05870 [Saccharicrinis sp. FJH62]|uniref:hypothetical protein n=1 Tax=Saccharicrinis sp. FJH62 TaxID=3344657 RepID=UPI0035D4EFF9